MATAKQKAASRRNIKKAQAAQRRNKKIRTPRRTPAPYRRQGSPVQVPLSKVKTLL